MTVLGRPNFFGQTFQATASGAIADGDPVVLNADGTVSAVSGTIATDYGKEMFIIGRRNDAVYRYTLGTAFDISTASYINSFPVSAQETFPTGLFFSPDGLRMFIVGIINATVYQYNLTSPYDISTLTYDQAFNVISQETSPQDVCFSPDGLKMFVTGATGDDVNEYALSSAFDISTASYTQNFSVASQDTDPTGLAFNTNGTKMFVVGSINDAIFEYDLSSGFDLSTASYSGTSFSVAAQDTVPQGIAFSPDGTKMFIVGDAGNDVNEYDLSVGFDISTAVYSQRFSVVSQDINPTGIAFSNRVFSSTNLTDQNYLGISDGAYADGTTATIQLIGSVDDAQSGLTAGELYYVQAGQRIPNGLVAPYPDFSNPTVTAGYAVSPTKLLVKGAYSILFD